jgi:hypothetical protein
MFTLSWLLLIFLVSCFHIVHAISIVGPVLAETFPSPSIIKVGEAYYAFSSRANREGKVINTPIATSNHFQSGWTHLNKDALPHPGQWTVSPEASVLVPDINQLARDPVCSHIVLIAYFLTDRWLLHSLLHRHPENLPLSTTLRRSRHIPLHHRPLYPTSAPPPLPQDHSTRRRHCRPQWLHVRR